MTAWLRERPWKGVLWLVLDDAGVSCDGDRVYVPYRRPDGSTHNRRVFAAGGRCWWENSGLELIPFGLETLPPAAEARDRALLVAEGESDVLALREAFAGVTADNPIRGYHVLGLPGAGTWRPEWRRWLEPFPLVYLLGDGDAAGRELNARVKRDVPWARPVWLPEGTDARGILQEHGPQALELFLERADSDAQLWAAFTLGVDLSAAAALLRGEEVSRAA